VNTNPIRTFECPVRLTAGGVSITSPKTGRTLTRSNDAAPPRVRGRIVQARNVGRPTATFTADELRAFVRAA
jgi:hypothetical protein